jgi:hypothetical protein
MRFTMHTRFARAVISYLPILYQKWKVKKLLIFIFRIAILYSMAENGGRENILL